MAENINETITDHNTGNFDKEYEEVDGYPALGMNANAGIRYTF